MTHSDNTPYTRGSKTARVKTARIAPGARLLTYHGIDPGDIVFPTQQKTNAVVRVVKGIKPVFHQGRGFYGRAGRTYTVFFTDGTHSGGHAPNFTWHALVLDTASSASRQHYIDTGWYLTETEVKSWAWPSASDPEADTDDLNGSTLYG